jgi:hypothetical protein
MSLPMTYDRDMSTQRVTQSDPTICGWIDWKAGRICGEPATHTEESEYAGGTIIAVSPLCDAHTLTPKGQ